MEVWDSNPASGKSLILVCAKRHSDTTYYVDEVNHVPAFGYRNRYLCVKDKNIVVFIFSIMGYFLQTIRVQILKLFWLCFSAYIRRAYE